MPSLYKVLSDAGSETAAPGGGVGRVVESTMPAGREAMGCVGTLELELAHRGRQLGQC